VNVIVAGSRDLIHNQHCVIVAQAIERWIAENGSVGRVLCGDCRGADAFGRHWADTVGVPVDRYRPDVLHRAREKGIPIVDVVLERSR
jgi:hypothetical protein